MPRVSRDADILVVNTLSVSGDMLRDAPNLKLVAVAGTGTDNVDLAAARQRGVGVCNVAGYCTASVVQHVWGLILSLTQHVAAYGRAATDGSWARNDALVGLRHPTRELNGRPIRRRGLG